MIKYSLSENQLNGNATGCIAKVTSQGATTLDGIIDYMVSEGTGLTRPQALAYFEKLVQSVEYFVKLGHCVSTPLFRVKTSICGTFDNKYDSFDSGRHQIKVKATSGLRLRKLENELPVAKTKFNRLTPSPEILTDVTTQTENDKLTPTGVAVVRGELLRFDQEDPLQGIFFIQASNPSVEVRVDKYASIRSAEIYFQVPELNSGEYLMVVRSTNFSWKALRKGELGQILTVDI